ncbi:MAG: hypothetical protein Q9185_002865 [Variospora sp. 1 TL-2023]
MVAPRSKRLVASRRRADEEAEDEEGSTVAGVDDDSMSDASAISDADEDADAEGSEISDTEIHQVVNTTAIPAVNGRTTTATKESQPPNANSKMSSFAPMAKDTVAMMNGIKLADNDEEAVEIHFDDLGTNQAQALDPAPATTSAVVPPTSNLAEKRRQEHEEYRKKRDADPAFVPNRGGFFMHDHRSMAPGQNGFRPFGRGRGRGRGVFGGPLPSASQPTHSPTSPPSAASARQACPSLYTGHAHTLHLSVYRPILHLHTTSFAAQPTRLWPSEGSRKFQCRVWTVVEPKDKRVRGQRVLPECGTQQEIISSPRNGG